MRLINVLEGGALFQDIRRDAGSKTNHRNRRRNRVRLVRDDVSPAADVGHDGLAAPHGNVVFDQTVA
ncbi:MAG: hypothetical protein JXO72_05480 [Vicinamibacteria bacterium]|nr:hypothetical protein [Vicinamibacteria bacterium]